MFFANFFKATFQSKYIYPSELSQEFNLTWCSNDCHKFSENSVWKCKLSIQLMKCIILYACVSFYMFASFYIFRFFVLRLDGICNLSDKRNWLIFSRITDKKKMNIFKAKPYKPSHILIITIKHKEATDRNGSCQRSFTI